MTERIRSLAYAIWEARQNYPHLFTEHTAQDDWLTAKRLVIKDDPELIERIYHMQRISINHTL